MRARVGRLENDTPSSLTCLNARTVGARLSVHLDGAAPCPRDVTLSAYRSKKFVHGQQHDITARDIQRRDMASGVFSFPKAIDTFCPVGQSIVTKNEIADVHSLRMELRVQLGRCYVCDSFVPTRRLGVGGDV